MQLLGDEGGKRRSCRGRVGHLAGRVVYVERGGIRLEVRAGRWTRLYRYEAHRKGRGAISVVRLGGSVSCGTLRGIGGRRRGRIDEREVQTVGGEVIEGVEGMLGGAKQAECILRRQRGVWRYHGDAEREYGLAHLGQS